MDTGLSEIVVNNLVRNAIAEDSGKGDATTEATVPSGLKAKGILIAKEDLVCAGLPVAEAAFRELDSDVKFEPQVEEGQVCPKGTVLAEINGKAGAMLTAERIALNFMQRMSGIATMTHDYVEALGTSRARILDTRKTTPGLRYLEKYAVTKGGGVNHRMGLYDRVMIKDNHRALASLNGPGGIARCVQACREKFPELEVEVEADTLDEVREAAEAGADFILLDNMTNEEMAEAVKINNHRSLLEASGGITLERIPSMADIGVDFISVGALTHSARSMDISLDIQAV